MSHSCFTTRRRMLAGLGASAVLVACNGKDIALFVPQSTTSTSRRVRPGAITDRVLVIVEMGGGNDGLNTVIPHADSRYYDLRPSLGLEEVHDLDGTIGFHPSLNNLAKRYADGQIAIIEGVGVPNPDLSHFVSMNTWWTANPDTADSTGWLGRYLDGTVGYDNPLAGLSIGPGPSRAMLGSGSFVVAIRDASGLTPNLPSWVDTVDELAGAWAGFAPADPRRSELDPVKKAIAAAVDAQDTLAGALGTGPPVRRRSGLTEQLDIAARLIASGAAPSIIYVHGFGDFDTHQGQLNRHHELMGELDEAIESFLNAVDGSGDGERVLILTTSEFGRRAADNGTGTDHGTAATHLAIGRPVAGGRYGESPSLAHLDPTDNLSPTVDFRSVYATVLDEWLQGDADEILGDRWERLRFVRPR